MLVVSRKAEDSLIIELEGIPETIEIKILEVGSQVRLGITAPEGCKVWRNEIYSTVQANRQAVASPSCDLLAAASQLSEKLS